jgi:hypothetical protein
MASIWYTRLTPVAFAATTAQAGFPASNLAFTSIGRPWYATSADANDVTVTFGAAGQLGAVHVHDVNFASANLYKSADGIAFNLVGVLATYHGFFNRRRGYLAVNDPNVKAYKITPIGAPTDGLGYWRIGAQYPFASSIAIGSPFQFSYNVHTVRSQMKAELANKLPAVARVGNDFQTITVPWQALDGEDIEPVVSQARGGIVLLDLGLPNHPDQVWPVRELEDDMAEGFNLPKTEDVSLAFTEVV